MIILFFYIFFVLSILNLYFINLKLTFILSLIQDYELWYFPIIFVALFCISVISLHINQNWIFFFLFFNTAIKLNYFLWQKLSWLVFFSFIIYVIFFFSHFLTRWATTVTQDNIAPSADRFLFEFHSSKAKHKVW